MLAQEESGSGKSFRRRNQRIRVQPKTIEQARPKPHIVKGKGAPCIVCPLCGGGPLRPLFEISRRVYSQCGSCESIIAKGPKASETSDPSQRQGQIAAAMAERQKTLQGRVQVGFLERVLPGGMSCHRVFDVGTGSGTFLKVVEEFSGSTGSGVERRRDLVTFASMKRRPVFAGDVNSYYLPERQFSLITMLDMVDELDSPRALMPQMVRSLRMGGHIVVACRNGRSASARANGRYWDGLQEPGEKVLYPSANGLRRLLSDAGLCHVRVFSLSETEWAKPLRATKPNRYRAANEKLSWYGLLARWIDESLDWLECSIRQQWAQFLADLGWGEYLVAIGRTPFDESIFAREEQPEIDIRVPEHFLEDAPLEFMPPSQPELAMQSEVAIAATHPESLTTTLQQQQPNYRTSPKLLGARGPAKDKKKRPSNGRKKRRRQKSRLRK